MLHHSSWGHLKFSTSVAKIIFCSHDLLVVCISGESFSTRLPSPVNVRIADIYATVPNTAVPQPNVPNLLKIDQSAAVPVGTSHVFYSGCPNYKFKSERAVLGSKLCLTLRVARQEARRRGFLSLPFPPKMCLHQSLLLHLPLSPSVITHSRQSECSTPSSTMPSPLPTSSSSPQIPVFSSPPYRKTIVSQTYATSSTSEAHEDIQN